MRHRYVLLFFFFNDTATTEIYTLSLHDALPIFDTGGPVSGHAGRPRRHQLSRSSAAARSWSLACLSTTPRVERTDRKSTRLNSSHANISYAVFCLKKKKKT